MNDGIRNRTTEIVEADVCLRQHQQVEHFLGIWPTKKKETPWEDDGEPDERERHEILMGEREEALPHQPLSAGLNGACKLQHLLMQSTTPSSHQATRGRESCRSPGAEDGEEIWGRDNLTDRTRENTDSLRFILCRAPFCFITPPALRTEVT